jgi:hypothetical protein
MGGFKMNMTLATTGGTTGGTTTATTSATTAPVSGFMKMSATTRRNCSGLKFQGKKYCKSCNDKN